MKCLFYSLLSFMFVVSACTSDESVSHQQEITLSDQLIGVSSARNARQLGGYRIGKKTVKADLLLRSGDLAKLSAQDSALLSEKFKLQRIYDFRGADEFASSPDVLPGKATSLNLSVSFVEEGQDTSSMNLDDPNQLIKFLLEYAENPQLKELCLNMYDKIFFDEASQDVYRRFFADLMNQNPEHGAILWHCTQGKDRAGSASAMLLAALGANRELIMKDFELSKAYYAPFVEQIEITSDAQDLVISTLLSANSEIFEKTLNKVDSQYGSLTNYLTTCLGVTPEMMDTLRDRYLE